MNPDYSPLRRLDDYIFLREIPFDWIVEFVDGDGRLAPAWAAESSPRYIRYSRPSSLFYLLQELDKKDGGRRLAVAAAAVFAVEGAACRLPRELINAARRVVSMGASDVSADDFMEIVGASGYAFDGRFESLKVGVEDGSALPYSTDLYERWLKDAVNTFGTGRSRASTRKRVMPAVLAAVPPPHISEVLALVEEP